MVALRRMRGLPVQELIVLSFNDKPEKLGSSPPSKKTGSGLPLLEVGKIMGSRSTM